MRCNMGLVQTITYLVLISIAPVMELRGSIPYGILAAKLPWPIVFAVCVVANFLVAPLAFIILDKFVHLFLVFGWFERFYTQYITAARRRAGPYLQRYGAYGLILFIGMPIPGAGVWTGSVVAYILGMKKKTLFISAFAGSLLAGSIVTFFVVTGKHLLGF